MKNKEKELIKYSIFAKIDIIKNKRNGEYYPLTDNISKAIYEQNKKNFEKVKCVIISAELYDKMREAYL